MTTREKAWKCWVEILNMMEKNRMLYGKRKRASYKQRLWWSICGYYSTIFIIIWKK